jgi:hypothetical protein
VRKVLSILSLFAAGLAALLAGRTAAAPRSPRSVRRLDSLTGLEMRNAKGDVVTYRGRRAVRLLEPDPPAGGTQATETSLAIVTESNFKDGTIEAEVAGLPRGGASETARGFIGIAFRVQPRAAAFEAVYLRPTNGRADDQLRRNHSTQYISYPQYPWERLRKEAPGVYESYVDLEPGVWTRIKITVSGHRARLYVNGAAQPCLIVNDLKLGETGGQVALWIGPETEGYFSRLSVQSE